MEGSQATHAIEPWLQLHNKVVTVTGASSGLGWDFCLDLAKAGCRILAAARLQSLRRDQRHGRITQFELLWTSCSELDVGASGSVIEASVHKAWDAFGTIDALMNNAGVRA